MDKLYMILFLFFGLCLAWKCAQVIFDGDIKKRKKEWRVGNSIVVYIGDVFNRKVGSYYKINKCKSCDVIYSDFVSYTQYPCRECGKTANVRITAKFNFVDSGYFWSEE